jgi:hypothetical protein
MGGLKVTTDLTLSEFIPDSASILILPGGDAWTEGELPEVSHVIVLENFWRRLTGSEFRTFVHAPQRMDAALEAAGLVRAKRRETLVWALELYRLEGAV